MSSDKVWQRLKTKLLRKKNQAVRVGVLSSKGGNETTEGGVTMVELAAIHEFGAPRAGIPERSFIRRTFKEEEKELAKFQAKLAKALVEGRITAKQALASMGEWGAAQVKNRVTSGDHIPPPLKPGTIAAKGSDRPLVDTGAMINSVTYEVED